jgi:hypothetical protein
LSFVFPCPSLIDVSKQCQDMNHEFSTQTLRHSLLSHPARFSFYLFLSTFTPHLSGPMSLFNFKRSGLHPVPSPCAITLCHHPVPSPCAFTLCLHPVPSPCAFTLCHHPVPSPSAFTLCLHPVPLLSLLF